MVQLKQLLPKFPVNDLLIIKFGSVFSVLILLHLSALFDTADHILLDTSSSLGFHDATGSWFTSYLSDCYLSVTFTDSFFKFPSIALFRVLYTKI